MPTTNRKDEVLNDLIEGIARLTTSEKWQEWLDVQSRFHRYSFNNTLLIQLQCHEATRIAGFHAWRKLGRNVRKGEKAIWILAPVTRKVDSDGGNDSNSNSNSGDNTGSADDAKPKSRALVAFKPAAVFDISQTDGEELPEIVSRLHGDDLGGAYGELIRVAHAIGYTVEEDYLNGPNGVCIFEKRSIRIEARNDEIQQVKTLAHELAHAMLHEDLKDRALAELEAESVAYVVMSTLGVDSSSYSFGYVASWAGGGDEAIAGIRAAGSRIQRTAHDILTRLDEPAEAEIDAVA